MGKTWSRDTNSRLPFGVNVNLNLSNIPGKVRELNIHTKEKKPDHFVTDELRFYMKREGMNCVKLCTPNTLSIDSLDSPHQFVQLAGLDFSATPGRVSRWFGRNVFLEC